jgi:hypothetical protein
VPTTWIPSAEAFGNPTQELILGASGIPSAEAFGTATVTHSSVIYVLPIGIPSGEAFGDPVVGGRIAPLGIPSQEAFGTAVIDTVTSPIYCSGTVFGYGSLTVGQVFLAGIATGSATVTGASVRVISLDPVVRGSGNLLWSGPSPITGYGTIVGLLEVDRVPPPICGPRCGCADCCGRRHHKRERFLGRSFDKALFRFDK